MDNTARVAISNFSPLVTIDGQERKGFEVDLWELLAKETNTTFAYQQHAFQDLIPLLSQKKVDLALAGITVTESREKVVDFSHATLDSGLLILISKNKNKPNIWSTFSFLVREGYELLKLPFLLVLIFILIFGNLLYFVEWSSKTFSQAYIPGIFEAFWLVICSMSTDSFGDYVPHTWWGRIITIGIIVGGVAIFGLLIAQVTAFITIQKIKGAINNYHDLNGKRVATVKGSTSVSVVERIGATVTEVTKIEDAYAKLDSGDVDAVVFDAPVLTYFAENEGAKKYMTVGDVFDRQKYAIAMQTESPLMEKINQALLRLHESGEYDVIYKKWFGASEAME